MGFRLGLRRHKENQVDNEKAQKKGKNHGHTDKLIALPSRISGNSIKSADIQALTSVPVPSLIATSDAVCKTIGDNQQAISNMYSRKLAMSPTSCAFPSTSLQPTFPRYSSYPASYVPQFQTKLVDTSVKKLERITSDNIYQSVYNEPLPEPGYPLFNDITGNSNRDSGIDTESRSSLGEKPAHANIYDNYSQWRGKPLQGNYTRMNSLPLQSFSHEKPNSVYSFNEMHQILRPFGYQNHCDASDSTYRDLASPLSCRKPLNTNETCRTPNQWVHRMERLTYNTYHPQTINQPCRCPYCSCSENTLQTPQCTKSLRRIQLKDTRACEKQAYVPIPEISERSVRKEDEKYTPDTRLRRLPRTEPPLSRPYGHLPRNGFPTTIKPRIHRHYDFENEDYGDVAVIQVGDSEEGFQYDDSCSSASGNDNSLSHSKNPDTSPIQL